MKPQNNGLQRENKSLKLHPLQSRRGNFTNEKEQTETEEARGQNRIYI